MPEDMHFPFEYDESGDIRTVTGDDFYYNHALQLGQIAAYDERASGLTATDITRIEGIIKDTYAASPYFDEPITVDITSTDDETLTADVRTANLSEFEIQV